MNDELVPQGLRQGRIEEVLQVILQLRDVREELTCSVSCRWKECRCLSDVCQENPRYDEENFSRGSPKEF